MSHRAGRARRSVLLFSTHRSGTNPVAFGTAGVMKVETHGGSLCQKEGQLTQNRPNRGGRGRVGVEVRYDLKEEYVLVFTYWYLIFRTMLHIHVFTVFYMNLTA